MGSLVRSVFTAAARAEAQCYDFCGSKRYAVEAETLQFA